MPNASRLRYTLWRQVLPSAGHEQEESRHATLPGARAAALKLARAFPGCAVSIDHDTRGNVETVFLAPSIRREEP